MGYQWEHLKESWLESIRKPIIMFRSSHFDKHGVESLLTNLKLDRKHCCTLKVPQGVFVSNLCISFVCVCCS